MGSTPLDQLTRLHKALAHPVRVRILAMLRGGELCVCQLNAVIGLAPSTISAHLADLKDAGLVAERKAGRWVHYRLEPEDWAGPALAALWPALGRRRPGRRRMRRSWAVSRGLPVEAICRPDFDVAALRRACCRVSSPRRRARA